MNELFDEVKGSQISLFYGVGVTLSCGGPSWDELFSAIRGKFSAAKSEDFFVAMHEIMGFNDLNRKELEDFIRTRLSPISPGKHQKYLFSMPWRAVLTTNYDSLPELVGTTIDESREIISVSEPSTEIDHTRDDRLYCFKLLGDVKAAYPKGGWMALSNTDLFTAAERRTKFFEKFRNLATSGHIIYLGYSFKDDLVALLLNQMKTGLGRFPWKGYAIMKSEPSKEINEKLRSIGITVVISDLEGFIQEAKTVYGEVPQSAPVSSGLLTVHRQVVDLDRSILSNVRNKFSIVTDDLLKQESDTPADFLRGSCKSLYPYVANWDFPRKTEILWTNPKTKADVSKDLERFINRSKSPELVNNILAALVGIAGSGKSVVADRIAFEWYRTGNPVIRIDSESLSIDSDALDGLLNGLRDQYLAKVKVTPSPLRWLIIADDCGPLLGELRRLKNHLISYGKPADILLVTRATEAPIEKIKNFDFDVIYRLDDTVNPEERDAFVKHFTRLGEVDEEILRRNLEDEELNSSFFALVYSSIRGSRETIQKLIEREYGKLEGEAKKVYRLTALIQSYRMSPLLTVVTKCEDENTDWLDLQVKRGSLGGVLRFADYGHALETPNRMIAETVSKIAFPSSDDRRLALYRVISTITYGDVGEMSFLTNLLVKRIELDIGPKLSPDHKIDLFTKGVEIVRSRPLLIHLGRLQTIAGRFTDAKRTLREAYGAEVPGFDERPEHIKDAEGRLESTEAEKELDAGNYESAWGHLDEAEAKFLEAKINPGTTPHPFEGLCRVYLTKARLSTQVSEKWTFILSSMQECNYVENYVGEIPEIIPVKKETENLLDRMGFDESHIQKITDYVGKANGYAYLAEIEASRGRLSPAFDHVEKGLQCDDKNLWLMRLRVKLLRKMDPSNHKAIMETLDTYSSMLPQKYDIELSFELAKETYISGSVKVARRLFHELFKKAKYHQRRLIPRDPEDRWIENGDPMRLKGTLMKMPTESRYGFIETTFPTQFSDTLTVGRKDIQAQDAREGEHVSYEVIFNMEGPEASRVRT